MKQPRGFKHPFMLKRWTENRALKATNARFRKIDELLIEIQLLWGDEDEYIVREAERLRRDVEVVKLDCVCSVQARAEEREAA